jgi:hypothetical protein
MPMQIIAKAMPAGREPPRSGRSHYARPADEEAAHRHDGDAERPFDQRGTARPASTATRLIGSERKSITPCFMSLTTLTAVVMHMNTTDLHEDTADQELAIAADDSGEISIPGIVMRCRTHSRTAART